MNPADQANLDARRGIASGILDMGGGGNWKGDTGGAPADPMPGMDGGLGGALPEPAPGPEGPAGGLGAMMALQERMPGARPGAGGPMPGV